MAQMIHVLTVRGFYILFFIPELCTSMVSFVVGWRGKEKKTFIGRTSQYTLRDTYSIVIKINKFMQYNTLVFTPRHILCRYKSGFVKLIIINKLIILSC